MGGVSAKEQVDALYSGVSTAYFTYFVFFYCDYYVTITIHCI